MYTMICVTGCIDEYIPVEELFFWLVSLHLIYLISEMYMDCMIMIAYTVPLGYS